MNVKKTCIHCGYYPFCTNKECGNHNREYECQFWIQRENGEVKHISNMKEID